MNAPTSSTAADKPVSLESEVEAEVSKLVEQKISRLDAERIRSSIVRLTSNSTDGLDSLSSELQALQKKLEGLDAARKEREEAGWQGLVKLYEAMKPRDAATIFNDLEMPVLLQVVDRMKEAKAAPVLAAMQPDKARDLTAKLAQMRTRRDGPAGS